MSKIDLNGLAAKSVEIAKKRAENGGTKSFSVRNLLKHCATEVVEAMEAYVEHATEKTDETKRNFVSELADIVCCCMIVAGHEDIDLEKAIEDCVEKNRKRAEGKGDKK
jgi:NTP pyrophosphatase (non-canonical NTP hydrolase)